MLSTISEISEVSEISEIRDFRGQLVLPCPVHLGVGVAWE